MATNISNKQAAEYLEAFTKFVQATHRMKTLGYTKTELKKDIDSVFR